MLESNRKLSIRHRQILSDLILTVSYANNPSCFDDYSRLIQQENASFSFIRILIFKRRFSISHKFHKHLFGTQTFKKRVHRGNCFSVWP